MKYKDPITGEWKRVTVDISTSAEILDTLPTDTIVEYDAPRDENGQPIIPEGWELYEREEHRALKTCSASFSTNYTIEETSAEEIIPLDTLNSGILEEDIEGWVDEFGTVPPLYFSSTQKAIIVSGDTIQNGMTFRNIKINAFVNFQTVTEGLKYILIKVDGTAVGEVASYLTGRQTLVIPDINVNNVAEGSKIELAVIGTKGDLLRRNGIFGRLTVELLDEYTLALPTEATEKEAS